jgi:hypothetical protein
VVNKETEGKMREGGREGEGYLDHGSQINLVIRFLEGVTGWGGTRTPPSSLRFGC